MTIAVLVGLVIFAVAYDQAIAWLERHHYDEGFVALEVVFGVGVTLAGVAILNPSAALTAFICFIASGVPMVIGYSWRYVKAREHGQRAIREGWGNSGDDSEAVAE